MLPTALLGLSASVPTGAVVCRKHLGKVPTLRPATVAQLTGAGLRCRRYVGA